MGGCEVFSSIKDFSSRTKIVGLRSKVGKNPVSILGVVHKVYKERSHLVCTVSQPLFGLAKDFAAKLLQ